MHTETADAESSASRSAGLYARPSLVLVLEASRPLTCGARFGLAGVDDVFLGRGPTRGLARRHAEGRSVLDVTLPAAAVSGRHARIVRDGAAWHVEDLGSKNGTMVNGRRVERAPLHDGDWIEVGGAFFRFRPRWPTPLRARDDVDSAQLHATPRAWRALVPELEAQYSSLERIAASKLSVLCIGETGTGKELLARAVHDASGRRGKFIAVNCGALPAALVEGLLFGHKRGAFSGAVRDEIGFVRAADGGTLFLDEIGDLPLASQAALLRVIQESEVVPVGETQPTRVDVRFVAATHRPIRDLATSDAFRSDLLARLSGFTFEAPPLRSRLEDLGLIMGEILARLAPQATDVVISSAAARALLGHAWSLNIRELEQALAASLQLTEGKMIDLSHLPKTITSAATPNEPRVRGGKLGASELTRLLEDHAGNVTAVARAVSKAPIQVRRWLKEHGLDAEAFRRRGA